MAEVAYQFLQAFIPILVAFNILGVVPLFISLTEEMRQQDRLRLINQATLTALIVALVFIFLGKMLFNFLGIADSDFRIGGGLVLLTLAISDLLFSLTDKRRSPGSSVGVVPIGIPLIMGPAALTTILIVLDAQGYMLTILALVCNLGLIWLLFRYSQIVVRTIGTGGAKAVSKVMQLILAGIAVKLIRTGIEAALQA